MAVVKRYGHNLKKSKIVYYNKNAPKVITGCVITSKGKLLVPNKQRKKIINLLENYNSFDQFSDRDIKRLNGLISSSRQIEEKIFDQTRRHIEPYIKTIQKKECIKRRK